MLFFFVLFFFACVQKLTARSNQAIKNALRYQDFESNSYKINTKYVLWYQRCISQIRCNRKVSQMDLKNMHVATTV